jgi:hypothetical protein
MQLLWECLDQQNEALMRADEMRGRLDEAIERVRAGDSATGRRILTSLERSLVSLENAVVPL